MTQINCCKRCGKTRESVATLIPYMDGFLCDVCVLEKNAEALTDTEDEEVTPKRESTDPEDSDVEIDEDIMAWSPFHSIDEETIDRIINQANKTALFERRDLTDEVIDPQAVAMLPKAVAEQFCLIPLRKDGKKLVVAFSDPTDEEALNEVKRYTGMEVSVVVADSDEIEDAITKYYEY